MSTYMKDDTILRPVPSDLPNRVKAGLPLGTYSVGVSPEGYFLQQQDDFTLPPKIYGTTPGNVDRILNTFATRARSTGVLLSGEKGSGKTLLATMLSVQAREGGVSTIIVNAPLHGEAFNAFIQSIDEPCVVIFDEFEKVYHQPEWQSALLTLLDGTAVTKKLFVVTTNDRSKVSSYMRNRPGRIFYSLDYETLDMSFIQEYCEDTLHNKDHLEEVYAIVSLYDRFNFDMLKALVEEMNRYGEDPKTALKMLNVKPDFGSYQWYEAEYFVAGKPFPADQTDGARFQGHPLQRDEEYDVDFFNMPRERRFETTQPGYDGPKFERLRQVAFESEHLVHVDGRKGIFEFENEGVRMVLKKEPRRQTLYDTLRAY